MKDPVALTDLQIELMTMLWSLGEATVVDVHRALPASRALAQATVATMLSRLEKKGAITHRVQGRQFYYRAVLSEAEVRRSMLAQVADRLFRGDVPQLIHQLLSERPVGADELAEVKRLIEEKSRAQHSTEGEPHDDR